MGGWRAAPCRPFALESVPSGSTRDWIDGVTVRKQACRVLDSVLQGLCARFPTTAPPGSLRQPGCLLTASAMQLSSGVLGSGVHGTEPASIAEARGALRRVPLNRTDEASEYLQV